MLRGFDLGILAVLGVALAHGVAWSIVGLTFGMVAVGVAGGWVIGHALKMRSDTPPELPPPPPADAPAEPAHPRRSPALAALLALMAYVVGSFVAFAIVQLAEGQGALLERLTPANFGAFMESLLDPPLLQLAVLASYVVVAWLTARPSRARTPGEAR